MNFFLKIKEHKVLAGLVTFLFFTLSLFFVLINKKNEIEQTSDTTKPVTTIRDISQQKVEEKEAAEKVVSGVVIYFAQHNSTGGVSVYKHQDTNQLVTNFSQPIKSIKPLSDGTLAFIDSLGFLDRGEFISIYDPVVKGISRRIRASSNFLIENYVLSPLYDAIVFWEVERNATTNGRYHIVYESVRDATNRRILIDEPLSDQTKFPIYWALPNTIFLDSYSVHKGGLHRGLFAIDPANISSFRLILGVDTYSSIPVFSPDGRMMAYTSYNPSASVQLPAPSVANGLFRAVIRNPNEVKVMDLIQNTSKTLVSGKDGEIYDNLLFNKAGDRVILKRLQINANKVNPVDSISILLTTNGQDQVIKEASGVVVYDLGVGMLVSYRSGTLDSLGGIGNLYVSPIYQGVYVLNQGNQTLTKILTDGELQILGVLSQ